MSRQMADKSLKLPVMEPMEEKKPIATSTEAGTTDKDKAGIEEPEAQPAVEDPILPEQPPTPVSAPASSSQEQ